MSFWKLTWVSLIIGLILGFILDFIEPGWPTNLPMIGSIFIEPTIIEKTVP